MINNYKDFLIVSLLSKNEMHGYDLLKKINFYQELKKITLYKSLERLEKANILEVSRIEGRRKIFKVTPTGLKDLKEVSMNYNEVKEHVEVGHTIERFEVLDSTNTYLKENGNLFEEGTIVTCSYQKNGHGRLGRVWEDKPNQNISMSILLKPKIDISEIPNLTQVVAASVFDSLKSFGIQAKIKWPNDILVNGKKIAGILIESKLNTERIEHLVVGIGLNVNIGDLPKEIEDKATSMKLVLGHDSNIDDVITEIINNFNIYYNQYLNGNNKFTEVCKQNSYIIGKNVYIEYQGETLEVEVIDIALDGRLVVKVNEEIEFLSINEVSLSKNYK